MPSFRGNGHKPIEPSEIKSDAGTGGAAGAVDERSAAPAPAPGDALRQQIEAQQRAEELQRQLAAQMRIVEKTSAEEPQFTPRDYEFLGARPGIQTDPRLGF